ncbi:hypothetical protein WN944_024311 [Citrus x changshan-huyou]|uniref:Uncharacterized protein n=1 Tax=Citrus x changshan-huyou TaxID=2935761 RepID=A0AAP0QBX7_9ROSI
MEIKKHDLTIKQANGEDLPFAIPWRDVYKAYMPQSMSLSVIDSC